MQNAVYFIQDEHRTHLWRDNFVQVFKYMPLLKCTFPWHVSLTGWAVYQFKSSTSVIRFFFLHVLKHDPFNIQVLDELFSRFWFWEEQTTQWRDINQFVTLFDGYTQACTILYVQMSTLGANKKKMQKSTTQTGNLTLVQKNLRMHLGVQALGVDWRA